MPATEFVQSIVDAVTEYQRDLAGQQIHALIKVVRSGEQIDPAVARIALEALRAKRWFDLLQILAEALIQSDQGDRPIRKLYAQALIDQGAISTAIVFLEHLAEDCPPDNPEHREACGLLGRAYKQLYVNGQGLSLARREALMQKALWYYDSEDIWHGINVVALRARAANDKLAGYTPATDLAEKILATASMPSRDPDARRWLYATAAEACVALARWEAAAGWIKRYLRDPLTDVFEIGSTLRQFVEVWQLETLAPEGAAIVELLRAALLDRNGGEQVAAKSIQSSPQGDAMLQRVFGKDGYQTLEWYRQGLVRSRAVARLGVEKSKGVGTGFLIRERDLDPNAGEELVLITNAHVLSETYKNALRPNEAVVTFESVDVGTETYAIKEIVWSSLPKELDATIARLDRVPLDVAPIPVTDTLPDREAHVRLYVIGYPLGGTMSFSINDNLMIDCEDPRVHYQSPTDPGSSGSPVFNSKWSLVALHHAGSATIRKLNGQDGTYEANEGLYIGAIAKAFRARERH